MINKHTISAVSVHPSPQFLSVSTVYIASHFESRSPFSVMTFPYFYFFMQRTVKQAGRQAGRQAGGQAGRQAARQAGRQAGRQVTQVLSQVAVVPLYSALSVPKAGEDDGGGIPK
jgi:predicted transposase YdaD